MAKIWRSDVYGNDHWAVNDRIWIHNEGRGRWHVQIDGVPSGEFPSLAAAKAAVSDTIREMAGGALDDLGALDPVRETVFEWFKEETRRVWRNADFVLAVTTMHEGPPPHAGVQAALLTYPYGSPRAIGDSILRRAEWYKLMVSDELLAKPPEIVRRALVHEAVHLGIPKHGAEFREKVLAAGGAVSEQGLEVENKVQVQKKVGSRYQTVREFPGDQEREAEAWAREQLRAEPGSRWRTFMGYDRPVEDGDEPLDGLDGWVREDSEEYLRGVRGWAKVGKRAGGWYVALGWKGDAKADKVQYTGTRQHARIIGEGWVADLEKL